MALATAAALASLLSGLMTIPGQSAPQAAASPPTSAACLPLVAGSTGLPLVGGQIPSLSAFLGGGAGIGATAPAGVRLPKRVVFADGHEAISNEYAFALRSGHLYVRRSSAGRPVAGSQWHELELPRCLAGRITRVSADHRLLTVLDTRGQLYSHDMPNGDLSPERWTRRWGPFLWLGAGMTMFPGVRDWAISEFNAAETFTDTGGRQQHPIGVATGYLLRSDRRTITYIDPWLPADESREVCGPRRGRLKLASLDASGSTIFVAGTDGSLWTRLYDFDLAGANSLLGKYTWQRASSPGTAIWQLPAPGWVRHAKPRGRVTDLITIVKTGTDARDRELRVSGRNRAGRWGYWHKPITGAKWRFEDTGKRLAGRILKGHGKLATSTDRRYIGTIGGQPAVLKDFNHACSGAQVVVRLEGGAKLKLRLHSEDALRQASRGAGLDDVPRSYNAALEVPAATWRALDTAAPEVREFVAIHLTDRITEFPLSATSTKVQMRYQCWVLTLNGQPARPDRAGNPLDVGPLLGFLRDAPARGALPTC